MTNDNVNVQEILLKYYFAYKYILKIGVVKHDILQPELTLPFHKVKTLIIKTLEDQKYLS